MPADYSNQRLQGYSFIDQNLEGQNFSGADIRGADFTGANLARANFSGADIRGTKFIKANLREANFTEAKAGLTNGDAETPLTKEDVVKLLAELETLVKGAELPAETKEEVVEDLSSASKAINKQEPNKNRALERLESVVETLEKTNKGVESGQKIWTTAKPIIVKIVTWLGVAASSSLLGL